MATSTGSELVKNSAALGILGAGGTRHPHVCPYTFRWLRSIRTQPAFARDEFFHKLSGQATSTGSGQA